MRSTASEMMDFVWQLNAAENSAFETARFYADIGCKGNELAGLKAEIDGGPRLAYLEDELSRARDSLRGLIRAAETALAALNGGADDKQ